MNHEKKKEKIQQEKADRLSAALKANLKRRKEQTRSLKDLKKEEESSSNK